MGNHMFLDEGERVDGLRLGSIEFNCSFCLGICCSSLAFAEGLCCLCFYFVNETCDFCSFGVSAITSRPTRSSTHGGAHGTAKDEPAACADGNPDRDREPESEDGRHNTYRCTSGTSEQQPCGCTARANNCRATGHGCHGDLHGLVRCQFNSLVFGKPGCDGHARLCSFKLLRSLLPGRFGVSDDLLCGRGLIGHIGQVLLNGPSRLHADTSMNGRCLAGPP
mmetsp:Transcript_15301/g.38863  ORF Transcript_15301/g.38863 Transcript_15301/m.38863 type:complete len:222 (-) Transcript_15301:29-694(-)